MSASTGKFGGSSSSGFRPQSTVASTASLRLKPYKRADINEPGSNDLEVFLGKSLKTLQKGTYNELDQKCQLDKYERFKYRSTQAIHETEQQVRAEETQFRDTRREQMINKDRTLQLTNTTRDQEITERWKETQRVKKDRQVRDLQYELALLKISELKALKARQVHAADQTQGVDAFERIMKRSGLGGGGESGGQLSVSYEGGEAFIARLEETARAKFPSNEEVGNFVTQLKERTQDNRVARYEKARRKRRAMVDQSAAAADK